MAVFVYNWPYMEFNAKKMAVFRLISHEPEALRTLLQKLGPDFNERTVRRWLSEMEQDRLIEKIGQKKATKYRLKQWEDLPKNGYFGQKSRELIDLVRRPLYNREPQTYHEAWLSAYMPNQTFYIPQKLQIQFNQAGKRSNHEEPAGTYARQIFNRLLIDLSYNSSRLEGNTYSLLDTERLLLQGTSAEGKLDEEAIMILNHKEAIRYLVDNASRLKLTLETIYTLHFLLSDGLVERHLSGKIRDHGVRIGGSAYIPLEGVKKLQGLLEKIVQKAVLIQDPFEQSFFLLVHISYLQAFTDVNKRTGRLCANISLIKNNLVPLSFNDVTKEDYTSAMIAIYEQQEVEPLLEMYTFSYLRTCIQYDATMKAFGYDEIRVRYRSKRREILRDVIVEKLTGNSLKQFVSSQSLSIKEEDRESFIHDVYEDLSDIDEIRMTGLGITLDQLNTWISLNRPLA